jgi:hypothetical protein
MLFLNLSKQTKKIEEKKKTQDIKRKRFNCKLHDYLVEILDNIYL